jgi:hypothetical protein
MEAVRPDGYRAGVWKAVVRRCRKGGGFMTSATYRAVADALDEAGDYQLAGS